MTNLNDLPEELLLSICVSFLQYVGIHKAVLLRRVCQRFNVLIQSAIFSLPTFEDGDEEDAGPLSRDPAINKQMVARLIKTKLAIGNAEDRPLCLAILMTAMEIAKMSGAKPEFYIDSLASCAAHELHLNRIVSLLAPSGHHPVPEESLLNNTLVAAILSEQAQYVRNIIQRGAKPTAYTQCFGQPLSVAARIGNEGIVHMLLKEIDTHDATYGVAAEAAVKEGHIAIVKLLMRHRRPFEPREISRDKTTIDREGEFWRDLAHTAIKFNRVALVRQLLDSRPELSPKDLMQSLLEDACRFGHPQIIRLILSRNISVSPTEPVFWAAYSRSFAVINALPIQILNSETILTAMAAAYLAKDRKMIEHLSSLEIWFSQNSVFPGTFKELVDSVFEPWSQSIDLTTVDLEREFLGASRMGDLKGLRQVLFTKHRSQAGFSLAALGGHPAALYYLYETLDPRFFEGTQCYFEGTILHTKSLAVVQVCLAYGWDINTPYHRLSPPLLGHIAMDQRFTAWFLDHGADPNARCDWDTTSISLALKKASFSTIHLLFQKGARARNGQLLHWAIYRNDPDTIQLANTLLNFGAPINELHFKNDQNSWKENYRFGMGTPLHTAVEYKQAATVSFLLDRGADPTIKDTLGRTPLELAKKKNLHEIIACLSRTKACANSDT